VKIDIRVECTPEEARQFLGLPDVAPMQERLLRIAEDRLRENIKGMDTTALAEQWMPVTLKGMEQLQDFWAQMARAAMRPGGPQDKPSGERDR